MLAWFAVLLSRGWWYSDILSLSQYDLCCLFFVSWRLCRSALGSVSRTLHARVWIKHSWSMERNAVMWLLRTSQQEFVGTFPSDRPSLRLTRVYLTVFSPLHLFYLQLIGLVWNERLCESITKHSCKKFCVNSLSACVLFNRDSLCRLMNEIHRDSSWMKLSVLHVSWSCAGVIACVPSRLITSSTFKMENLTWNEIRTLLFLLWICLYFADIFKWIFNFNIVFISKLACFFNDARLTVHVMLVFLELCMFLSLFHLL